MNKDHEHQTRTIEVLLIEDSLGDARLLEELLAQAGPVSPVCRLTRVERLSAGLSHLENSETDIVLLDLGLPDSQGFETFTTLYAHAPAIPVILLSGVEDEALALKAVQAGAQDYLVKDKIDGHLLVKSIHYALERHRFRQELAAGEARFRAMIERNIDGILVLDNQSIIRYANPAAVAMFGQNATDLIGQPFGFPASLQHRLELDVIAGDGSTSIVEMEVAETEWAGQASYLASLRDVTERKRVTAALEKRTHDLTERVKELNCLFAIASIAHQRDLSLTEALQQIVEAIPPGWQYPKIACAQLSLSRQIFQTGNFKQTEWELTHNIMINGQKAGAVSVCYLKAPPASQKEPFLKEEKALIQVIAGQVATIVERIQAEETVRESEKLYRLLAENSTDLISMHDVRGVYQYVSPACRTLLGYEPKELIGRNVYEFFHYDDLVNLRQSSLTNQAHPTAHTYSYRIRRKDGRYIWFETTSKALGSGQAGGGIIAISRDITERKQADKALQESEVFNRAVLSSLTAHIAVLDETGKIIAVNEAWEQFARQNGDPSLNATGVGVNYLDVCQRATREARKMALEASTGIQAVLSGSLTTFTLEYPCHSKTEKRWYTMRVTPLSGQRGAVVAHHNITERKLAEEAVRQNEARLRAIVTNLPVIFYAINQDGIFTLFEGKGLASIGFEAGQVVGQSIFQVYADAPEMLNTVRAALAGQATKWVGTLAGRTFEAFMTPVWNETKQVSGLTAIAIDVTQREQTQIALQRQLNELTVLHAIATVGAQHAGEDELIEQATQIIGQSLYPDNFGIGLVDKAQGVWRPHPSYRGLSQKVKQASYPLGKGITGTVAATGRPWRVSDVRQEPAYIDLQTGMRSKLCVPLTVVGEVIGVINAERAEVDAFSQADEQLLITVAHQLATAIDRGRLFEATRRRADRLEAINKVAAALRPAYTRSQMLPVILDQLFELLAVDSAILAIVDVATDELIIEASRGEATEPTGQRRPISQGVTEIILTSGRPYVTADPHSDPRLEWPAPVEPGLAVAGLPLLAEKQAIGVIWVGRQTPFGKEDLQLLTAIADMAANALHRTTLYEQTQRHLERMVALRNIDQAISTSLDLTVILEVILTQVREQLQVDAADVLIFNVQEQALEYRAGQGFHTDAIKQILLPLGKGYAGRVALEKRNARIANLQIVDDFKRSDLATQEKFIAYFAVPLVVKDRLEGVLEIFHRAPLFPNSEWVDFLEAIAGQSAIAIENVHLFQETRRLLRQTQDHARQIRQIVDTVPEGVLLLDARRRLILANPTAQEYLIPLTQASVGDILTHLAGHPLTELLKLATNNLPQELEISEPSRQIFEFRAQAIETGPERGGWLIIIRDITREREVQQRIHQQERLAAVGQLAAGIAHDFNNILTSVIGFAELARFSPATVEPLDDVLDRIIGQGHRAAHLIRQILDFSRQSVAERHPLDLTPLIRETVKLLERTIPENIHIEVDIASSHRAYVINGNSTQIQQVLTNLAVNARDAMPGGGTLQIHLSAQTISTPPLEPGEWLVLTVSDTGEGIAPDNIPHIFEPFFTTKAVGKGTGLGLAQVYGIIKQHGGDIDVSSQVKQGTTFTIYLPFSTNFTQASGLSINPDTPQGQGELILLVEDDQAVRNVTQAILEALKYKVITATNGQEALVLYNQHRDKVALVLTDLAMPEMDGLSLAQRLREQNPEVAIIAMTGYPQETETKELLAQGIIAWLQKPLSVKTLAQTVRQALS